MVNTRGIEKDEINKKKLIAEIQKHIDSITAVLVLTNGTVPRITLGMDYVLSTLSALVPKSFANNIAFLFTNVASSLAWNCHLDTIPHVLRDAEKFLFDNPVAFQERYLSLEGDMSKKKVRARIRKSMEVCEEQALEMLVQLFDWLDGLESLPTTEIVYLYNLAQSIEVMITNTLAQMDQAATMKEGIDKLMVALQNDSTVSSSPCSYLTLNLMLVGHRM